MFIVFMNLRDDKCIRCWLGHEPCLGVITILLWTLQSPALQPLGLMPGNEGVIITGSHQILPHIID